jgi:UDP-3-O-[3-hydroxymyristoyl] glucosamine N-acyltransferase
MILIKDIAEKFHNEIVAVSGDMNLMVSKFIPVTDLTYSGVDTSICWMNDIVAKDFCNQEINIGLLIVSDKFLNKVCSKFGCTFYVSNPRRFFQLVIDHYFKSVRLPKVESTANIDSLSKIGNGCYFGKNVIIESDCVIGDNCEILHNTVIFSGTIIENNVKIGSNCSIGNTGFGYEKDDFGNYVLIQHLGNVKIGNNVQIRNNVCIDKAVIGSTVIGENVMVDNLVHIAHGVKINNNSLIIAHAMVAGSVVIGENSWISPGVMIKNKIKIGSNALLGIGSVIINDVKDNEVIVGNPGGTLADYKEWSKIKKNIINGNKTN